jgi:hypothetical protein
VRTAPPRCSLSGAAGGSLEWRACGGLEGRALARHVATLLGEQSGELRRTAQRSENRVLLHPVGSAPAAGDRARERRQRLVGVLLLRQHAGCAVLEACRLTALFADGASRRRTVSVSVCAFSRSPSRRSKAAYSSA